MKIKLIWLAVLGISLLGFTTKAQETNSYDKTVSTVTKGVSTVYDDLKQTAPKIEKALTSLGKELKVGVNAVWDILVKQQLVWSIAFLILTLSAVGNWFVFYNKNFRKIKNDELVMGEEEYIEQIPNPEFDQEYYDRYVDKSTAYDPERRHIKYQKTITKVLKRNVLLSPPLVVTTMSNFKYLHLVICLLLSAFSFWHFNDMLTGFINPQFGAMKTIAEIASQIK